MDSIQQARGLAAQLEGRLGFLLTLADRLPSDNGNVRSSSFASDLPLPPVPLALTRDIG